jgi:hypothetical protein
MSNRESPCDVYNMIDGYLYVADSCIISHEIPIPGEETQIKGNKKVHHIHLSTSVILFSPFQFCFTINAVVFRSLPYQCFTVPASEVWLAASSQRGQGSHPGRSMGGGDKVVPGQIFFRAPGFFLASIISPMFPIHITLIYSSCYSYSLISR